MSVVPIRLDKNGYLQAFRIKPNGTRKRRTYLIDSIFSIGDNTQELHFIFHADSKDTLVAVTMKEIDDDSALGPRGSFLTY